MDSGISYYIASEVSNLVSFYFIYSSTCRIARKRVLRSFANLVCSE